MQKNRTGQKVYVFAFDRTNNVPQAGDAAQISCKIGKDWGALAPLTNQTATELEGGFYSFAISAGEVDADHVLVVPSSTTPDIQVIGVPGSITLAPLWSSDLGIESTGEISETKLLTDHVPQTADHTASIADILSDTGTDGVVLAPTATSAQLIDDVWDEVLTGGTHNVATSSGRRLRSLQDSGVYDGGYVYIDTINGTAGTTDYENGTVNLPVDSIEDALTIAASIGFKKLYVYSGSSVILSASMDDYVIHGDNYSCDLAGQSVSGTTFRYAKIIGSDNGSNANATIYEGCLMGTNTLGVHRLSFCGLSATITLAEAGTYDWVHCHSRVAGTSTPVVNEGAAVGDTNLNMRFYSGGIEVQQMGTAGNDTMSLEGDGQIVINANCSGGTIAIRGNFTVTDNAGGAVTLVDGARYDVEQVNAQCDASLETYHLDHLFSVDYDPVSPPGAPTALMNELVQDDGGGISQFTVIALENGSSGLNDISEAEVKAQCDQAIVDAALATASNLADVDANVVLVMAQTDKMNFEKAGELNTNMRSINSVTIVGDGVAPKFGV